MDSREMKSALFQSFYSPVTMNMLALIWYIEWKKILGSTYMRTWVTLYDLAMGQEESFHNFFPITYNDKLYSEMAL